MIEYVLIEGYYLFFLPEEENEAAKTIPGNRWEPHLGCWIFPRNQEVRAELQKVFKGKNPRPLKTQSKKEQDTLKQELKASQSEVGKLRDQLQNQATRLAAYEAAEVSTKKTIAILREQAKRDQVTSLHSQLEEARIELGKRRTSENATIQKVFALSKQLDEVKSELDQCRKEKDAAQDKHTIFQKQCKRLYEEMDHEGKAKITLLEKQLLVSRTAEYTESKKVAVLEKELAQIRKELEQYRHSGPAAVQLNALLKEYALEISGNSAEFKAMLQRCPLDQLLSIHLKEEAELMLYSIIGDNFHGSSLMDMILFVKEKNMWPEKDIQLLYLINKQRNAVAHPEGETGTLQARGLLSFFAVAILWGRYKSNNAV